MKKGILEYHLFHAHLQSTLLATKIIIVLVKVYLDF